MANAISRLDIGFRIPWDKVHPLYWEANPQGPSGAHADTDVLSISSDALATNAIIVAQSGSGKSFLLGRLIEEIILNTKARCLVLDPNADYRLVSEVNSALWDDAGYDIKDRRGFLPTEKSEADFAPLWKNVPKAIRSVRLTADPPHEPLHISWPSLPVDIIAPGLERMVQARLGRCHRFVSALSELCSCNIQGPAQIEPILKQSAKLLKEGYRNFREDLEKQFDIKAIAARMSNGDSEVRAAILKRLSTDFEDLVSMVEEQNNRNNQAQGPDENEPACAMYFARARELLTSGLIREYVDSGLESQVPPRLEVIDLPSLQPQSVETRLMTVSSIIAAEWLRAHQNWEVVLKLANPKLDPRVPTFLIVDEAHNLIPREPRAGIAATIREQFRTIAVEGRKYGMFLILVTQRPDRIDSTVLSECNNQIFMKIGDKKVIEHICDNVGVPASANLFKAVEMKPHRGIIAGQWSPKDGPTRFYVAARRTIEGGRSLQPKNWAVASR